MEIGKIIAERYRVVSFLAKGGMGAVYEVEHVHTGEHLALKLLFASLDEEALSRFKREASVAARIKSEHVVRVIDAGVLDGAAFLVMDLLEGADLEANCGSTPQAPDQVVAWLRDVAQGLAKAHELGLVHRDLKPQNLFLTKRPDGSPLVKILDFGIVKHAELDATPTLTGRMLGTPMYMAPEQAHTGELPITKSADLYSLGLVAFRLLSGTNYRRGETMLQVLSEVLKATAVPPSERGLSLGDAFNNWFAKTCATTAADRFSSAPEEIEALAEALGLPRRASLPAPASSGAAHSAKSSLVNDTFTSAPTTVLDPRPHSSRRRAPLIAVVVVLLAGAVLVVGPWSRKTPAPVAAIVASASAAPKGVGIADGPMSETKNDAARTYFHDGMRRFSLSSVRARESFDAAIKEDPLFASAHLQRALLDQIDGSVVGDDEWDSQDANEARRDVRAALAARASLPPRDQGLLAVLEPMLRDPADLVASRRAASELAARMPNDAEVAFVVSIIERLLLHGHEALAALQRCVGIDSEATLCLWAAATLQGSDPFTALREVVDLASARRDAEACRARDPGSVVCRYPAGDIDRYEGRCSDAEREGRELGALDPENSAGYCLRVDALAGINGPLAAVRELSAKCVARILPLRRAAAKQETDVLVALYEGDLDAARALSRAARLNSSEDRRASWFPTMEMLASIEIGDTKGAADLATEALALAVARPAPSSVWADQTGLWLRIAYAGNRLSSAAFVQRRDAWVSSWRARMDDRQWRERGAYETWLTLYSPDALPPTKAEALEVIEHLAPIDGMPLSKPLMLHSESGGLGSVLLAAERSDDAIAPLQTVTRQCRLDIRYQMRPALDLGRALALKGDRAGACKAFEKVLVRWGHAKPRSVTAEKARAEATKLGCDPVP